MTKNLCEIDWDEVPEVISKDRFYKICHISKKTARRLLISGAIPCNYNGKKTHCYQIKKEDAIHYVKLREFMPELYHVDGKNKRSYIRTSVPKEIPNAVLNTMEKYYYKVLVDYKDVMTTKQISELTGYEKNVINKWCLKGYLRAFKKNTKYLVPKAFLVEFFCSFYFRSIVKRTKWHNRAIDEIASQLE